MDDQPAISHLSAENFLSFRRLELDFAPLNVLVGPNGAGKTNILKIFQFLGDVARQDLIPAIAAFGGLDHLTFRGVNLPWSKGRSPTIRIAIKGFITKHASIKAPDEYKLAFWRRGLRSEPELRAYIQRSETIIIKRTAGRGRRITLSGATMRFEALGEENRKARPTPAPLSIQKSSTGLAMLRRLGEAYNAQQVEEIAQVFEQLRLFEIDVERVRLPSSAKEAPILRPDGANLAPFLLYLHDNYPSSFIRITEDIQFILPGFEGFVFTRLGGSDENVRVDIKEKGLRETTALARASFGTVRSIALFAMLHDPNPPKLTCLEEIDHGLHPYALDLLVDRLRNASKNTQFILATHSPALVNRLSLDEFVIVERGDEGEGSRVLKPDPDRVRRLREETGYELGELWFSGLIGGTL